ncbi:hypothetical protein Poly30_17130 [Planctomycetes bacterium Poly30]|uniref:Uncharacterized protein n=2 Tax=Saltatorellus ferox TaxID=2528018 RepID=A0A518EQ55_9BACT|nr:hypothetical protein Poly30_17130 [Planctomycetes bacterium Poly30]
MNDPRTDDSAFDGLPAKKSPESWQGPGEDGLQDDARGLDFFDELDDRLASAEIRAIERVLLEDLAREESEALTELERLEVLGADAEETQSFVDSLKDRWLAEVRQEARVEPMFVERAPGRSSTGKTALLATPAPGTPSPPGRLGPRISPAADRPWGERIARHHGSPLPYWPLAAAAAALFLLTWGASRTVENDTPVYLGPSDGEIEVSFRGASTRPEVLPEIVDFSGEVPEHVTFRIEIHDVTKDKRLDDVTFDDTTYEPRWICSESTRAQLPEVMRFEVHREVEPPYAPPMWSRVYARQ